MADDNFMARMSANPRPIVVDFWAPWCGPCRAIEPALKKLGQDYEGQVDVWRINADENPDLLRSLNIYGIPTLIAFRDGQEVARHVGAAAQPTLKRLFESAINTELGGDQPTSQSMSSLERLLRLVAGLALIFLAYSSGLSAFYFFVAVVGAVIAFSAVHDRCPIWQAIAPRLSALFRRS